MGNFIAQKFFKRGKEKIQQKQLGGFYSLEANDIKGDLFKFSQLQGKKLFIIVNVASKCGFTQQHYAELQEIYSQFKENNLEILAFPCNQFLGQESLCEKDIESYVRTKLGVEFKLFSKIDVNGPNTHSVFQYLRTNSELYDPLTQMSKEIPWNFSKFIVDKDGLVRGFYPPTVSPKELKPIIQMLLK